MGGMEKVKGMGVERTDLVSATRELWGDKIYVGKILLTRGNQSSVPNAKSGEAAVGGGVPMALIRMNKLLRMILRHW